VTTFGIPQLRKQLFQDATLGEQARDIQGGFDAIPIVILRTLVALYSEPLALGTLIDKPVAIEVIQVVDQSAQETPVKCGTACHFVWRPQNGGAVITNIDGMSPTVNGGRSYRFTFRITFAQRGSV
jgi:hypothetical protein